jgi:hypothetical protein
MLAYVPFLDPINLFHDWWYLLLIPLSFGISVIYRALKVPNLDRYWRSVFTMTAQITLAMVALGIGLVVLVVLILPLLPVS